MSSKKFILIIFIILLGVPITIFQIGTIEIPLSDVAVLVSLLFYLKVPNTREKIYISLAIGLSILSVLFISVFVTNSLSLRPFASLLFFFRPYLLFFTGYYLIKQGVDLKFVLSSFAVLFFCIATMVVSSIIWSGQPVRIERFYQTENGTQISGSALSGSLFGLSLYATWGIHSLAVFYGTMIAIVMIYFYSSDKLTLFSLIRTSIAVLSLLYLIIGSVSREVILGTILFLILMVGALLKNKKTYIYTLAAITLLIISSLLPTVGFGKNLNLFASWTYTLERSIDALSERNLDQLISGRLSLIWYSMTDLYKSPLFGVGFHGYQLYGAMRVYTDETGAMSSPHNQYLTAVWKMGIIPSIFYFAFLYRCIRNLYKMKKASYQRIYSGLWMLVLVYALVFCMAWDVLLVPLTGSFMMFIMGGVTRIYYMNRVSFLKNENNFRPFTHVSSLYTHGSSLSG